MTMSITGTAGVALTHSRKIWSPVTDHRRIEIALSDGRQLVVPVSSDIEFLALSLLLNEPNVVMLPDGAIVGWR